MNKMFLIFIVLLASFNGAFAQRFVEISEKKDKGFSSESFMKLTSNGAWCWFSDPRAVFYEGAHKRTYAGWIDNFGDVYAGYYDHETQEVKTSLIYDDLEIDDHNNPSLLFDENGRLLVFFNMHMKGVQPLFLVKAEEPESIDSWGDVKELFLNDPALKEMGSMNHTYTNPVRLAAENNRIFLFWRGVDGKPSYSYSDDKGDSWSKGEIFFMPERVYRFRRPYLKVYSDGKSRIHFTLTDGHPLKEKENNIYYFYYEKGSFWKADGSKIKDANELPVLPAEADLVYNAAQDENKARAWNWDIAQTEKGYPVIAYSKYPTVYNHIYCYAIWDGKDWKNFDLIDSGSWFPETMEGVAETEPYYSGGMNIDHETPGVVYLSVNRDSVFEIEKWTSRRGGKKWKAEKITSGSPKDNIRPFAVRGAGKNNPLQVLWMENTKYIHFAYGSTLKKAGGDFSDGFHAAIKTNLLKQYFSEPEEAESEQ
ncbi:MAG: BNR-4 repeat-containing protein [Mariniphaga sp.]